MDNVSTAPSILRFLLMKEAVNIQSVPLMKSSLKAVFVQDVQITQDLWAMVSIVELILVDLVNQFKSMELVLSIQFLAQHLRSKFLIFA